jgi:DNA-binding response OmpR family regulator
MKTLTIVALVRGPRFASRSTSAHSGTMRVLVVEDEPSVRHVVDRILTPRGYDVILASTAYAAAAILLDFPAPPDVALLDLVLPGKDGLVYATELQGQFPKIRFVFMTGWINSHLSVAAEAYGPLLAKPFTPEALLEAIGERP